MHRIRDIKRLVIERLKDKLGSRESVSVVDLIIESVTTWDKTAILSMDDPEVNDDQVEKIELAVNRVLNGEPVQYVLGTAHFYGREFIVNPSVLIPRQETEELVKWIIDSNKMKDPSILDIGTGSACLSISLKLEIKGSSVFAIDISEQAIETARLNGSDLKADVQFAVCDALNEQAMDALDTGWDIIVSNPPYITIEEKDKLPENVRDHEPALALFCDDDPLLFFNAIGSYAFKNLNNGGQLFFEVHEDHASEVMDLIKSLGFSDVELKKDIHSKERMLRAAL